MSIKTLVKACAAVMVLVSTNIPAWAYDPYLNQQWTMQSGVSHIPEAWVHTRGGGVKVGIIDSPIDAGHPDLPVMVALGGSSGPPEKHGTNVAGILAAVKDNGIGMAGVAPDVVVYRWSLETLPNGDSAWDDLDVANAITAMANAGVKVINMSLGFKNPNPSLFPETVAAINYAVDVKDVVIVCAAGNQDLGHTDFPANHPKVVAVNAYYTDGLAHGQGAGNRIDVLGPGWINVLSTDVRGCPTSYPDFLGGYDEGDYTCVEDDPVCDTCSDVVCPSCFGGTSAAAPFVAGVAALVRATNPALKWSEVRDILRWTADKLPAMNGDYYQSMYGYGLVNAEAAVLAAAKVPANGIIGSNTTWSGKVVVGRDLTISQGATLNLNPGTQVFISQTDALDQEAGYTDRVEFHVRGLLTCSGVTGNRIVIRPGYKTPTDADWVHMQALGQGGIGMAYTDVSGAELGLISNGSGDIELEHCTLSLMRSAGVRAVGNNSGAGVLFTSVAVTSGDAIRVQGDGYYLEGNTLTGGSTGYGVALQANGLSGVVLTSTISGFERGISLTDGSNSVATVVRGNNISNCTYGIYMEKGKYMIGTVDGGNEIYNCVNAIKAVCVTNGTCPNNCGLSATVRRNNIHNNTIGVLTRKTIQIDVGNAVDPGNNIIINSSQYCIQNVSTSCGDLPARGNYYGACNPLPPLCFNGPVDWSNPLCAPPGSLTYEREPVAPSRSVQTAIVDVHPNPFNPVTTVTFDLKESSDVMIGIYNVTGQLVRQAALGRSAAGRNRWTWDGRDQRGSGVSSGIYFVVLKAGNIVDRRKAVLLK